MAARERSGAAASARDDSSKVARAVLRRSVSQSIAFVPTTAEARGATIAAIALVPTTAEARGATIAAIALVLAAQKARDAPVGAAGPSPRRPQ